MLVIRHNDDGHKGDQNMLVKNNNNNVIEHTYSYKCTFVGLSYVNDSSGYINFNTLRTGSFKLFKRPFPGFLTILTL